MSIHSDGTTTGSRSIQIMTYNAAIQVAPGDTESQYGMDFEACAALIAEKILLDDPDVVILNEVNQNASKDVFVQKLQGRG
jgi:hypothetical protein